MYKMMIKHSKEQNQNQYQLFINSDKQDPIDSSPVSILKLKDRARNAGTT